MLDLVLETSDNNLHTIPVADKNEHLVRRIVREAENPHPILIVFIILITLLLIYYIYVSRIKPNHSGEWFCEDYDVNIKHNTFNDTFIAEINEIKLPGIIIGNAIYLSDGDSSDSYAMGVYDKGKIHWTHTDLTWRRPIYSK